MSPNADRPAPKVPIAKPIEMEAQAEVPQLRPPVAFLCLFDDGKAEGEWVRLRADSTIIGRAEGDVRIPHDGLISGRHAEIVRQRAPGGYRWTLVDLESRNGTFVRVGNSVLKHDSEVIIGSGRYRFEFPGGTVPDSDPNGPPSANTPQATVAWNGAPIRSLVPSLVEVTPAGPGNRFTLLLPEYWIGRDAKCCALARPNDVLANARHARLHRDPKGQWHLENNKSLNGLWLRIHEPTPLGSACHFRLGEQRFLFRVAK